MAINCKTDFKDSYSIGELSLPCNIPGGVEEPHEVLGQTILLLERQLWHEVADDEEVVVCYVVEEVLVFGEGKNVQNLKIECDKSGLQRCR